MLLYIYYFVGIRGFKHGFNQQKQCKNLLLSCVYAVNYVEVLITESSGF